MKEDMAAANASTKLSRTGKLKPSSLIDSEDIHNKPAETFPDR